MRHRRAVQLLPESGTGSLDRRTEAQITSHAESCSDCREWLDARDLLAWSLAPADRPAHPASDLLALCVIRPEELDEPDRVELRLHLERCRTCRDDLDGMREAVRAARHGSPMAVGAASSGRAAFNPPGRLLAAGLATLLVLGSFALGGLMGDRQPVAEEPSPTLVVASSTTAGPTSPAAEIRNRMLAGTRVIRSRRGLVVSDVEVAAGADITLLATDGIAFGDGFSIAAGARFQAGSSPSDVNGSPPDPSLPEDRPSEQVPDAQGVEQGSAP